MSTQQPLHINRRSYDTDAYARLFIVMAIGYLLIGLGFGLLGAFQYAKPGFLKNAFAFNKTRPLHVYLVITWIFTAAQGMIYYFLPRVSNRGIYWSSGVKYHFYFQAILSLLIVALFFSGQFGGREYLEFPPWVGGLIFLSWVPLALNFFATLRPRFHKAPVYIWSWATGIIFFFITLSESYLWVLDHFNNNIVRDITVQWKALGSMVGSWNMLVYGVAMYIMTKMRDNERMATSPVAFAFYFLGLTNLMFNWGHHTYIVPAAPWIKTVSYLISMTELLLLAHLIRTFRKTLRAGQKHYNIIAYRFLTFADAWILFNLTLAITISIPAINRFTHGTHITVAHAMGTTIGINTMLILGGIFYILREMKPVQLRVKQQQVGRGILITNLGLLGFLVALIGSGVTMMLGRINRDAFAATTQTNAVWYIAFAIFGVVLLSGIGMLCISAMRLLLLKKRIIEPSGRSAQSIGQITAMP